MTTTPESAPPALQIAGDAHDWQALDLGLVREAYAAHAECGISHVQVIPPWHLLQPSARHIDKVLMQTIERLCDCAHQAGLRVIQGLLSVREAGVLCLPDWHNGPDAVGWLAGRTRQPVNTQGTPARISGRLQTLNLADPYATESWLEAQRLLLQTVVGYFDGHPAISHWQIADGWSRLADTTPRNAEAWLQSVHTTIRRVAPKTPLMTTIDGPNLLGHVLTVERLAQVFDVLVVDCAMPEIPRRNELRLSTPAAVLVALVAALGERPVVAQLAPLVYAPKRSWQTIPWHQQQLAVAALPDEDVVRYHEAVKDVLTHRRAIGVLYPNPRGTRNAPLMRVPTWQVGTGEAPSIDAERYRHDPRQAFAQMWRDV
jgi:hypothetical protein